MHGIGLKPSVLIAGGDSSGGQPALEAGAVPAIGAGSDGLGFVTPND